MIVSVLFFVSPFVRVVSQCFVSRVAKGVSVLFRFSNA